MEEKRGIRIYDYSNNEDKTIVDEMIKKSMMLENLVPIIGAGFSSEQRTRNGMVPSVEELKQKMIDIICKMDKSDKSDFDDISLSDLADVFWDELDTTSKDRYSEQFREYVENNFTSVFDVKQSKRHFLNSDWKAIFTLNYDDTIEQVLDIDVVIPYEKCKGIKKRNSLIKIHGDAKRYAITGDLKYCIMGNKQYVDLVKSDNNKDIVNALENAFYSKSILFVGCSLENEMDILYSAGMQLKQKVDMNKDNNIIYVLYEGNNNINPIPYLKFGITDIIKVDKTTIEQLYEKIYTINKERKILQEQDDLKEYTNIKFECLDDRDEENLDYLFYNDKVNISNGKIKMPSFFVQRKCGKEVEESILKETSNLYVIFGAKFSGKTYTLLQLLKNLKNKKVYYFPSYITLSDDVIKKISQKEDAVILIDDKAITFEQYRDALIPLLDDLNEKNIQIVVVADIGDSEFYKHYKRHKNADERSEKKISFFILGNKFDEIERKAFNDKGGNISLIPYKENETMLDYLYRVDESILKKRRKSILPEVNFLSNDSEKRVRALIVLTTKGAVSTQMACELGIDGILYEMLNDFSITIQKDYLANLEKSEDHYSGFKFVLNSSYWAIKSLSNFASGSYNHKTIVKAYKNIVQSYSSYERREMNNKIKLYYMLDRVQVLFSDQNAKGTIKLPYMIYEGLHPSLNWNYQFLHQEAKCELRMARKEKNSDKKKDILDMAYRNICLAIELTENSYVNNIEYTRVHMQVTKALILINYVIAGEKEQAINTIYACHEAFVIGECLCPQLEKEELRDVKGFLESNWQNRISSDGDVVHKFNELYSKYINKPNWSLGKHN